MRFALFVCSDFANCGRPFRAVDRGGGRGVQVHCPYCREGAERVESGAA